VLFRSGCEKSHNDYFRDEIRDRRLEDLARGRVHWASIQQDGGVENVYRIVERILTSDAEDGQTDTPAQSAGGNHCEERTIAVGVLASAALSASSADALAELCRALVAAGVCVVVPETASFLSTPPFLDTLCPVREAGRAAGSESEVPCTLEFAASATLPGPCTARFHVMKCPTDSWTETVVGLAATGVATILAITDRPVEGHPFVPVVSVSPRTVDAHRDDVDATLADDSLQAILDVIADTIRGTFVPSITRTGRVAFQITRGRLGVSV
jgi:hypothetical protein